jgi:hypothetical protein
MASFILFRCTSYSNTQGGFAGISNALFLFCSGHDNTLTGFSTRGVGMMYGCLAYDNTDDGITSAYESYLLNCVVDGNLDDGVSITAHTLTLASLLLGCRITNHSGLGDIGLNCNSEPILTIGCFFQDNDGDDIQNATVHQNISIDGTTSSSNTINGADTLDGYTDDDPEEYNLTTTATKRRIAISIPVA